MTPRPAAIALLVVSFAVSACSSAVDDGEAGERPSVADSPSASATAAARTCPELTADVPDDLVNRRLHTAKGSGTPAAVGVIWSNKPSTRVVNVSSAPSDEEFGDGAAATPTERTVQGVTASEIVVGDLHRVTWRQPEASEPCSYWAVIAQGVSEAELDAVLESVKETP